MGSRQDLEGFMSDELIDWLQTLMRAERGHANTRNNYQDSYALWGLKASYKAREGLSVYVQACCIR